MNGESRASDRRLALKMALGWDLEKRIAGALRSTIAAHGPIGSNEIGSAAKRILGVVAEDLLAALRERVD